MTANFKHTAAIPQLLLSSMDTPSLRRFVAWSNRTRRRNVQFGLNGAVVYTTRKLAREAAIAELAGRPPCDAVKMPASDPLGVYLIPPGDGRTPVTG